MAPKAHSQTFQQKKSHILSLLSTPSSSYNDLSPKGSLDIAIVPLIASINALEGLVTTSSCAGRISVFLEGEKKTEKNTDLEKVNGHAETTETMEVLEGLKAPTKMLAGSGGKGGGGSWLFVSHDPLDLASVKGGLTSLFGLGELDAENAKGAKRFVHLKFEAMILHVFTASLTHAQHVLSAALQAGFRESGAMNVGIGPGGETDVTPMVAVRSLGLMLDSIIGYVNAHGEVRALVAEQYLKTVVDVANERFKENTKRIETFRRLLMDRLDSPKKAEKVPDSRAWEDAETRRARKRAEGLKRKGFGIKEQNLEEMSDNTLKDLEQTLLDNV